MEYWEILTNHIKYAKVSPYGLFNGVEIVMYPHNLDRNYPQDFDYHFFSQILEEHVKTKPERLCFPKTCYRLRELLKKAFTNSLWVSKNQLVNGQVIERER